MKTLTDSVDVIAEVVKANNEGLKGVRSEMGELRIDVLQYCERMEVIEDRSDLVDKRLSRIESRISSVDRESRRRSRSHEKDMEHFKAVATEYFERRDEEKGKEKEDDDEWRRSYR